MRTLAAVNGNGEGARSYPADADPPPSSSDWPRDYPE
jgi:hypothetical protein